MIHLLGHSKSPTIPKLTLWLPRMLSFHGGSNDVGPCPCNQIRTIFISVSVSISIVSCIVSPHVPIPISIPVVVAFPSTWYLRSWIRLWLPLSLSLSLLLYLLLRSTYCNAFIIIIHHLYLRLIETDSWQATGNGRGRFSNTVWYSSTPPKSRSKMSR